MNPLPILDSSRSLVSGLDAKRLILIVENSREDARLIQMALDRKNIPNPIQVVHDGEAAIDYLRGTGAFADRQTYPFPGMIFLDLKLPKVNGFEVLQWLKTHQAC